MNNLIKKVPFVKTIGIKIKCFNAFFQDYKFYINNYMYAKSTKSSVGYEIQYIVHSLEKGMTNNKLRPFGIEKIKKLIQLTDKYLAFPETQKYDYPILLSINILREYKKIYEENHWNDHEEYILVNNTLKKYTDVKSLKVGIFELDKSKIQPYYNDYEKFVLTRHSIRSYSNQKIDKKTLNKVLELTTNSPSACNRQMCKIYNILNENKKKIVINYGQGFGNFDLTNAYIFVITYDTSAFINYGEKYQGLFNAGLLSMNFVNAFHSFGIGSCFIQFANSYREEKKLKQALNIPNTERIAVIISAGYYNNITRIPCSVRKNVNEIYKEL